MKLNRVDIQNFRSIKDSTIQFDKTCRVLVGINESGKSNVIKALSLLDKNIKPIKKDDLREESPEEEKITSSFVRFVFNFDKGEMDTIYNNFKDEMLSATKNPDIIEHQNTSLSVKDFCLSIHQGLYIANILSEKKYPLIWRMEDRKICSGWKKPSSNCPQDFITKLKDQEFYLSKYKFIYVSDYTDIPNNYLDDVLIDDVINFVTELAKKIVIENLPSTLYWEYDAANLLPSMVDITQFSTDPTICSPLKNMFLLNGIENIQTSLTDARGQTPNQFQNYLDRIANKTTDHFKKVWKDHQNIEFSLRLNADKIIPGIKELNTHDFSRRSDGFKRFITFLLMISVNVKTDNLCDTLLLIDEPDESLHPTGARYLRDELIRIAKKNYVVYSTHSIFMIDSGDINRHYIVKKKDEITEVIAAEHSNIVDEEVLYNALGYSVFSVLKDKNIIFEGWKDKHLFLTFLKNSSSEIKTKFKNIGICHSKGAKAIKTISPMIELANRECLIISDNDSPAIEQQKLYRKEKGFGNWYTYKDIDSSLKAITGEDFIKNDFIVKHINTVISTLSLPKFDIAQLPTDSNKLSVIDKWLRDNAVPAEQTKDLLTKIKGSIFDNLKPQNIEDIYLTFVEKIPI